MRKPALAFFIASMKIEDCFKVAYILKPHGLKGEVTISLDADFPADQIIETIFVEENNRLVPYFIEKLSIRGNKAFVKFDDVDTHESASKVSRKALYLPKSFRPKSTRGEFYDDEVIGFEVIDAGHGSLGQVQEVITAGANKLLLVLKEKKEVLIPVNSPFIKSINKTKKTISVELPDGFLDI
jgi:16S rRNA processing protein RimM